MLGIAVTANAAVNSSTGDVATPPSKFLASKDDSNAPSLDMTTASMEAALTDLMLGKTQLQQATSYVLINDAMAFVVALPVQL